MPTPTSDWPSSLPGPAWHSWRCAWDHIMQRTLRGVPEAVQARVLGDPGVQTVCDRMSTWAAAGDVPRVQHTAQVWLQAVKRALAAQRLSKAA